MGIKPLPHFEHLLHTFAMQYKIGVQGNIETVGWSKTLLNNRLLLKGVTFAKMCDTFRQEPFYIKITWLINLTDVILTQLERVSTRIFLIRNLTHVIFEKRIMHIENRIWPFRLSSQWWYSSNGISYKHECRLTRYLPYQQSKMNGGQYEERKKQT